MNAVIVFAKFPEDGNVKTRLSRTLGVEFAVRFYTSMAEHAFNVCLAVPKEEADLHLYYDYPNDIESIKNWIPAGFSLHLQKGKDLGEKMKNAFGLLFEKSYKKVIIIGTDCPDINVNIILKSFEELSRHDITIGPSNDGGYYLLGMNRFYPFLFDDNKWSSNQVLTGTIEKINENKLSLFKLPELIDIDNEEDLRKWLSKTKENNEMTELMHSYGIR
jgi:rSAM/selenodomain-associated transferase 1